MMLVSVVLVFVLAVQSQSQARKLDDAFETIGDRLGELRSVKKVNLDEAKADVRLLSSYLEEAQRNHDSCSNWYCEPKVKVAMRQLAALNEREVEQNGQSRCSRRNYELLKKLRQKMDLYEVSEREEMEKKNRAQQVVGQFMIDHANYCQGEYAKRYATSVQQDKAKQVRERVYAFEAKDLQRIEAEPESSFRRRLGFASLDMQKDVANAFVALEKLATKSEPKRAVYLRKLNSGRSNNGSNSKVINEREFEKLYDEYLVEPCRDYVGEFGSKVFELAEFDRNNMNRTEVREMLAKMPTDYLIGLAHHSICVELIPDSDTFLQSLIEHAHSLSS